MKTEPIFLIGAERSGTTLLRLLLDHHPNICFNSESEYFVDLISDENVFPDLEKYKQYLRNDRVFNAHGFEIDESIVSYDQLVKSFLVQFHQRNPDKQLCGATVHRNYKQLLSLWPHAKFIHLLRDGRDVARSNIPMGWAGNVWYGVEKWIEAENLIAALQKELNDTQYLLVKYEEMVKHPEKELTRMCEFVGVEYSPEMQDIEKDSTYKRPDPALTSQWKKKLSNTDIRLLEYRIGDMLGERGYELSGLPPKKPNAAYDLYLRVQDKLYKIDFRRKRFGTFLFLIEFSSRKLGINSIHKKCTARMNEIIKKHLK